MNANKVFGLLTYFSISSFIFGLLEFVQFGILIKTSVIVFGKYFWKCTNANPMKIIGQNATASKL